MNWQRRISLFQKTHLERELALFAIHDPQARWNMFFQEKKFCPHGKVRKSPIYKSAQRLCRLLAPEKAYFVGGCVRDMILNPAKVPTDIDIATDASPAHLLACLPQAQLVGASFGVVFVRFDGFSFEIASFRKDGFYSNKRTPDSISQGTMQEDSCRRDFTINALYFDPTRKKILDFHEGLKDLKYKIIKTVGAPKERFQEDTLRILRALRFAANLNFQIHKDTLSSSFELKEHLAQISQERMILELKKVLCFSRFVKLLWDAQMLNVLFPKIFFVRPTGKSLLPKIKKLSPYAIKKAPLHYLLCHLKRYCPWSTEPQILISFILDYKTSYFDKTLCIKFIQCAEYHRLGPHQLKYSLFLYQFLKYTLRQDQRLFQEHWILYRTFFEILKNISPDRFFHPPYVNSDDVCSYVQEKSLENKKIQPFIDVMNFYWIFWNSALPLSIGQSILFGPS